MIPFFRRFFRLFARDEAFFERVCRSVLAGVATGGAAFADQIAAAAGVPRWANGMRIAAAAAAFLSLMIAAGQKNSVEKETP